MRIDGEVYKADVDSSNRLLTSSAVLSRAAQNARDKGELYSWTTATYNYDAADTILLVRNDSATKSLYIESVVFSGDTASEWKVHVSTTAITAAGTAVTGVNLNLTSNNSADATAKADETGNSIGSVIHGAFVLASTASRQDYGGALVLPQNGWVGVDVVTNGAAAVASIVGWFE
jgi:hypothetical protein